MNRIWLAIVAVSSIALGAFIGSQSLIGMPGLQWRLPLSIGIWGITCFVYGALYGKDR